MERASHCDHPWAPLVLASLLDQPAAVIAEVAVKVGVLAHSEAHGGVEEVTMSAWLVVAEMVAVVLAEESWEEQTTASVAPGASAYAEAAAGGGIDGWRACWARSEDCILRAVGRMRSH